MSAEWTYDRTLPTVRDKVRLMIPDTDEENQLFYDAELDFLLQDNDSDIRLAGANALEIIASNQVLVQKVMTILDVSTQGDKVAASLMARASRLREEYTRHQDELDGGFDFAEMVVDDFTWRERLRNEIQRGQI